MFISHVVFLMFLLVELFGKRVESSSFLDSMPFLLPLICGTLVIAMVILVFVMAWRDSYRRKTGKLTSHKETIWEWLVRKQVEQVTKGGDVGGGDGD